MNAKSVQLGEKFQITIPKDIVDELGLQEGDQLECQLEDGKIMITPSIPYDQAWFWSKEWQEEEHEADGDIKADRVKRFDNVDDLIEDLNKE